MTTAYTPRPEDKLTVLSRRLATLRVWSDYIFAEDSKRKFREVAEKKKLVMYHTSFRYHQEVNSDYGDIYQAECLCRPVRPGENPGSVDYSDEWLAEYMLQSGKVKVEP